MNRRSFLGLIPAAAAGSVLASVATKAEPGRLKAAAAVSPGEPYEDYQTYRARRDREELGLQDLSELGAPASEAVAADAWREDKRREQERRDLEAHLVACADCRPRVPEGTATAVLDLPVLSSRALWTAPPGTVCAIGRAGRPVERIAPYYQDPMWHRVERDVRVRLLGRVRCPRREAVRGVDARRRPDGAWIIRAWVPAR